jgi:hypothetical protein
MAIAYIIAGLFTVLLTTVTGRCIGWRLWVFPVVLYAIALFQLCAGFALLGED